MSENLRYFYHGSCHKIGVGEMLHQGRQYNRNSTEWVSGVFATSSLEKAKYFGIVNCIAANVPYSRRAKRNKKIYMEDIAENVKPKFYIYLVGADGFVLDDNDEYICPGDVMVQNVIEFDLVETLESEGWEIYLTPHTDKNAPVQQRIEQMSNYITSNQAKRINVAERISVENNA